MKLDKIIAPLVLIGGIWFIARSCVSDYEKDRALRPRDMIRFESRVNEKSNGLLITNNNDFSWPEPVFTINGTYKNKMKQPVKAKETCDAPFADFKNDVGAPFKDLSQFHSFDIRTATMYSTGRR